MNLLVLRSVSLTVSYYSFKGLILFSILEYKQKKYLSVCVAIQNDHINLLAMPLGTELLDISKDFIRSELVDSSKLEYSLHCPLCCTSV